MPGAIIALDQDRPGGPSYGSPGQARNDLWQSQTVTCRCTTSLNSSFLWELLYRPPGSAAVLADATTANATFDPDLSGSYRIQLTTNGGGPGNVMILIAAVRFDVAGVQVNRGWRVPAVGETLSENNFSGQTEGWAEAFEYIIADLLANGFGGGGGGSVGQIPVKQPVIVADYVCVTTDYCIPVDTTAGPIFVDLLAGAAIGKEFRVQDVGGALSTNAATVRPPGGETINGAASLVMTADYSSYALTKLTATQWGIS